MNYIEINKDIFTCSDDYYITHCISSDYELGKGIAYEIEQRFHIKNILLQNYDHSYPDCIIVGRIINLVTKNRFFNKPTYKTLELSLYKLRLMYIRYNITKIAMPKIGCGLDKLNWIKVREIIKKVFEDTNINIVVYYL